MSFPQNVSKGKTKSTQGMKSPVKSSEKKSGGILKNQSKKIATTEEVNFTSTTPIMTPNSNDVASSPTEEEYTQPGRSRRRSGDGDGVPRGSSKSPSKSPARKPKKHSEEMEELKRNWKTCAMK